MIDYHIHIERGPYNLEWVQQFWAQAKSRGISEIGITEHAHNFREFKPIYEHLWQETTSGDTSASWLGRHFQHSIEEYLELLEMGRKAGIFLKVGLEADYFPHRESEIRSLLRRYSFDFVLGSVHFLGSWSFDWKAELGWPGRELDDVYLAYIELVKRAAQSELFDVLSHLDVIKVFGHRARRRLDSEWAALLQLIAEEDLAIEVSTAGLRKPVGEIYPHPALIKEAARLNIPITLASDAHTPADVGDRWEEAVAIARASGCRSYCSFTRRKRVEHELPSL
ncbi:MAG: histidinol-phosphatase HisJ family protein [Limnochordia bacterium]|nr:histidinol-phosphatase HisJ family protein [Limnochordia bacterium]